MEQDAGSPPTLEKWYADRAHRAAYVAELDAFTRHLKDQVRSADDGAVGFAQSTIKTGFLLNGGALVAIPAAVALFAIDARGAMFGLLAAGGLLVLGLLATWSASICGFFALYNAGVRLNAQIDKAQAEVTKGFYPDWKGPAPDSFEAIISKYQRWVDRLRLSAIVFSLASFALFVAGTYHGAGVLVAASMRNDAQRSEPGPASDAPAATPNIEQPTAEKPAPAQQEAPQVKPDSAANPGDTAPD